MNFDDIFNSQDTSGISPEKLAFLKAMSSRPASGNAQEMMATLMSITSMAQKQGISFSDSERDLMLELLVKNLPPAESAKAKRMIQLVRHMKK